jgi:hypothetical protein
MKHTTEARTPSSSSNTDDIPALCISLGTSRRSVTSTSFQTLLFSVTMTILSVQLRSISNDDIVLSVDTSRPCHNTPTGIAESPAAIVRPHEPQHHMPVAGSQPENGLVASYQFIERTLHVGMARSQSVHSQAPSASFAFGYGCEHHLLCGWVNIITHDISNVNLI